MTPAPMLSRPCEIPAKVHLCVPKISKSIWMQTIKTLYSTNSEFKRQSLHALARELNSMPITETNDDRSLGNVNLKTTP